MKRNLLLAVLLVPLMGLAQPNVNGQFISKMSGAPKESYQGMDIYGDYLVSCQNTGIATVYHFDGNTISKIGEPFHLGCFAKTNHSNVASFGTTFYDKSDKLPLLYVSQAYKLPIDGKKDLLYAERINPDTQSSELVQTICFNDTNHLFGYALQWVIDKENKWLYGYGNTINNNDPNNKHRIIKFHLPSLADSKDGVVMLNENDVLENYLIEDTYSKPFNPVGQGLYIKNGLLFMPTGFGSKAHPSLMYVWNLKKKKMHDIVDLITATKGELEDCTTYHGDMIMQGQIGMFKLSFSKKMEKKLRLK
jgi:hypothetical protein